MKLSDKNLYRCQDIFNGYTYVLAGSAADAAQIVDLHNLKTAKLSIKNEKGVDINDVYEPVHTVELLKGDVLV